MPLERLQLVQVARLLLGGLRQRVPLLAQLNIVLERGAEPGVGLLERAVEQRDAVPQLGVLPVPLGGALPEPRRLALEPGDPAGDGQRGDAARQIQLLVGVPRQHRQHAVRQRELRDPQPRRRALRRWHRRG